MQRVDFWMLIEKARSKSSSSDELADAVSESLANLRAEDISDFDSILNELLDAAYTHDLWAAAYLINGGASDDGFLYFRAWLIAQGSEVFQAALTDADSLATIDVRDDMAECEDLLYAAVEAYEQVTRQRWTQSSRVHLDLLGQPWTESDLAIKLPHLHRKSSGGPIEYVSSN